MNPEQTNGKITEGNHVTVVEPDHPRWGEFVGSDPAQYVSPDPWGHLRDERDRLLRVSDLNPRNLADLPQTEAARDAWLAYRQALRDLPDVTSDPLAAVWPDHPQG
ncbi:hypothetical protein JC607_25000 [Paracoccus sp. IB05]|nr:hypothetical protein [Paracoccus sp. IB05]